MLETQQTTLNVSPQNEVWKKQFTTVTPFSKALAAVLFVALPCVGFWLGYGYGKEMSQYKINAISSISSGSENVATATLPEGQASDTVTVDEPSVIVGTFSGYYLSFEKEAWESTSTCHGFVVTDGNSGLIEYFRDLVIRGNTVQSINEDGNLVLNLPWEEIPEADKAKIKASNPQEEIGLFLEKKAQTGKGAAACHSFFSYRGLTFNAGQWNMIDSASESSLPADEVILPNGMNLEGYLEMKGISPDYYYPCYSSDNFVVYEVGRGTEVGSDFIVQSNYGQVIPGKLCPYAQVVDEYILNDFDASYIEEVYENLLVLDSGTGPGPRGLTVYDLSARKVVFDGSYMSSSMELAGSEITYWEPINIEATRENCPMFEENVGYGHSSGFEEHVILNMQTLLLERTGKIKCSGRQ